MRIQSRLRKARTDFLIHQISVQGFIDFIYWRNFLLILSGFYILEKLNNEKHSKIWVWINMFVSKGAINAILEFNCSFWIEKQTNKKHFKTNDSTLIFKSKPKIFLVERFFVLCIASFIIRHSVDILLYFSDFYH